MFEKPQREQIVRIKIEAFSLDLISGKVHLDGTSALKNALGPIGFDTAMHKIFRINGQQAIQFRGELYIRA